MSIDRTTLPAVGPDPAFTFPPVARTTLASGLQLRVVEVPGLPIVCFSLVVPGGLGVDAAGQHGLCGVLADMLDEGTGVLGALDVSDALARIGADYDLEVGADATTVSLTTLARFAERGGRLLADMALRPALRQDDFTRVRQLRRDRLRQMKDVPGAVAERAIARLLYGTHPYGHLAIGDDASLAALELADVVRAHRAAFVPGRCTLVVAGGVPAEELAALGRHAFGDWTAESPGVTALAEHQPVVPSPPRLALVPRPGAAQSELRIGRLTVPRRTPDYAPLVVMNAVLGGQFVSRINLKLREEKGFTYGARTSFDWKKGVSPLTLHASVHTASTAEAVADVLTELDGLRGPRPVTVEELELAKASLTRGYPQHFQTVPQLARAVGQLALYELPDDYFSSFTPTINAVTADDVGAVALRYLDPSAFTTLVVGDDALVREPLARLGPVPLEVIEPVT